MHFVKLSLCQLVMIIAIMTSINASRHGGKKHFHDSSELGDFDIDQRLEPAQRNRNHRGRAVGHQASYNNMPEFEQGIPGLYPIRGPPQAPLILPPHPGRGVGLQNYNPPPYLPLDQIPNNVAAIPTTAIIYEPQIFSTRPNSNNPPNLHYAENSFSMKPDIGPTTNKNNPMLFPSPTNQLPTSDKPATTTPSYLNPRRYDLMYGSNLLEEDDKRDFNAQRKTNSHNQLFTIEPHCQQGKILINNRCRLAV